MPPRESIKGAPLDTLRRIGMDDETRELMERRALFRAGDIARTFGERALFGTRRQAAMHEAGHAVAYVEIGESVRSVRIFRRNGEWAGFTNAGERWEIGPHVSLDAHLQRAMVTLAGPMAEITEIGVPSVACAEELELALAMVESAAVSKKADTTELGAQLLLMTFETIKKRRPAMRRLAAVLQTERRVNGDRLNALLSEGGA